jgi:type I restriction-modification system DNA methylase subunit
MTYTKDNLRQIFQQPFNAKEWQQMLRHYFQATELRAEPERIDCTTADEQGYYLGAIDTTDSYRIGLFYYQIQHGNVARKRVGLRNLVKSFINPNWGTFDAALVVFDSGSVWRLSFVCDIKGENTAAKRYTYVFGEGESFYNTPVGRFDALQRKGISFENIKDAFSVEALSKEFFDEYREHYADIVEYITGKRYVKEKGKWVEKTIHEPCHEIFNQFTAVYKDPEKTVRDYIKKLMGRLVFLQFLQKKEWMGVPADRQDWKGGDTRFLQNKFNEFADKDNFIDGFLEPLFNDLNTNRQNSNDLASPKVGSDIKIPFLNGGLFQLDEEDCSNIRLPQHLLGDVLDFFERYNFTIDENDPNDAQIGVDPEMLGRVFENLLEDNKDKGAFYTPKEIVQYMCQESLIAYLQTGIDDESKKESIRQFVLTHESEHLGSMAEDISIKLLNVKICDPAIGSGAFPMGLLRQLYLCQCAIHPELVEKNAADIKRHIIQNNIYGVDIEKGAVDIARLRFWLSLIVDEETPRFLPNLDFKIMQGNSLLEQYKGVDLSKMTTLSTEQGGGTQLTWFDKELDILRFDLREKLNEYYNCSDHQRKEQLKQEIIENVKQQLREQSINVDFGDLDLSANDQFSLWHTWFYDVFSQGGFDIVIANPPYVDAKKLKSIAPSLRHYVVFNGTADLYTYFYELALTLLSNKGVLTYITSNKWIRSEYGRKLRKLFLQNSIVQLVDFGRNRLFGATVDSNIIVVKKISQENKPLLCYFDENTKGTSLKEMLEYGQVKDVCLTEDAWLLKAGENDMMKSKIEAHGVPLKNFGVNIFRGILTGFNKAYHIDETKKEKLVQLDPNSASIIKPLICGNNTEKYFCVPSDLYLIATFPSRHYNIDDFPAVKQYLLSYGIERLEQTGRTHIVDGKQVKSRKKTHNKWFETQDSIGYWEEFTMPKIIWQAISKRIAFAYDPIGSYFCDVTTFFMTGEKLKYILAILNSKLFEYALLNIYLEGDTFKSKNAIIQNFPIPKIDEDREKPLIDIVDEMVNIKSGNPLADISYLEKRANILVYHLYGLTYDEVLIVDPETPITREEFENNVDL